MHNNELGFIKIEHFSFLIFVPFKSFLSDVLINFSFTMLLGDYLAYTNVILRKWSFDKEYIKSDMSTLPARGMI